jgi:hypothetical protein
MGFLDKTMGMMKCSKCKKGNLVKTGRILLSKPAKFECICDKCGAKVHYTEGAISEINFTKHFRNEK